MTERLRWWVIPGAVVVLLRIVTLDPAVPATVRPAASPAAIASPGTVIARDASGQRSDPMVLSTHDAFVLHLPSDWAGRRVSLCAWRRIDGARDSTPWFFAEPRVRRDAMLPIAGMQPGRYDVEIRFGEGDTQKTLGAEDLVMPGTHALSATR